MKYLKTIKEMFDPMGSWDPKQLEGENNKLEDDNLDYEESSLISYIDEIIDEYNTHNVERRKRIEEFFNQYGIKLNFEFEEKFNDSRDKLFKDVLKSNMTSKNCEDLLDELNM